MAARIRLLYVDDEPLLLEIAKLYLERSGEFTVRSFTSAPEALNSLSVQNYEAIIADYQMPGMDGIAFLKAVRELFGDTPFILFTGKGQEEVAIDAINNGADFYLKKGGDLTAQFTELAHKIRQSIQRRRAESESRFVTAFKRSPISLTLVSAQDGRFVDVNDTFTQSTGYSHDEVVGRTAGDVGIFADRDEYHHFVTSLREQREIHGMEMRCRVKSGEIRVCRFSSGIIGIDGTPHILSTVEDVTEKKEAEAALQALVRSMVGTTGINALRAITETLASWLGADCVVVGEVQQDRESVKTLSLLLDGKEMPDHYYTLEGTPCGSVIERGPCIYQDDVSRLFPGSKDLVNMKARGYAGTPLRDSRGDVIGILCVVSRGSLRLSRTMREILETIAVKAAAEVERLQMEHVLHENRLMLAEAMDLALLANWEYDVGAGTFSFDDRFYTLYGTTAERERGTWMSVETYAEEFMYPEERHVIFEEMKKAEETTDPRYISKYEHRIVRRDGDVRSIVVHQGIMKDSRGRTVRIYGLTQDVTEVKRTEEALRRANRQLSLLNGITRHDILNKITITLGYLQIARMKCKDPVLSEVLRKTESALKAIQSQTEFTRVYQDLGTQEPRWRELESVMPHTQVPAGVVLRSEVQGISVYSDPMLEKVFSNLLDNSVRHGEGVTEIRVSSAVSGEDLVVVWEDDGIGIAEEEKEKIFERGYGKNTGLGMFLAREVLTLTGITIRETGLPGRGARFEIRVPAGKWHRTAGKG